MFQNPLFHNGEVNEKVIRNPHADRDHHQKLTTSRGSSLANACQVWSKSVSAFVIYPVYKMTEWQTERSYNSALLSRRSWEQLHALVLSICSFVCLSVCLSQKFKKTRFSQKLSNLELWCLLTTYIGLVTKRLRVRLTPGLLQAVLSKLLTYYVLRPTQPPTLSGTGNE